MIHRVIVYSGHASLPKFGPYYAYHQKNIDMFRKMNGERAKHRRPLWDVEEISGEHLSRTLERLNPKETLFVMPAGESTNFDRSFTDPELRVLQNFFQKGGKGYFTCGSAYWASRLRRYEGICQAQPEMGKIVEKISRIQLFPGVAKGPLCTFPGESFKTGYYSDGVKVTDGKNECTMFLSGGGSFIPDAQTEVLARYPHAELERLGKKRDAFPELENAVVLERVGEGAVILSMLHPESGSEDMEWVGRQELFQGSGTDWANIQKKLSPEEDRLKFLNQMLFKLEDTS